MAARGMCARDVLDGERTEAETGVVPDAGGDYDLVLVAVRRDQLTSACAGLAGLAAKTAVVFFGNNPAGRLGIPADLPGDAYLGFPGVGGVLAAGPPITPASGSSPRNLVVADAALAKIRSTPFPGEQRVVALPETRADVARAADPRAGRASP